MAVDPKLLEDPPDAMHSVALFNPGESEHNTIVLGGVDVVIPLEMDMDGDPFQDDAVCLRSYGGEWEHALQSSDPEVVSSADQLHLYYPFHSVPSGLFHIDVLIAGEWTTVVSDLLVSRGKAWLGGKELSSKAPESKPAKAAFNTPEPPDAVADDVCCS